MIRKTLQQTIVAIAAVLVAGAASATPVYPVFGVDPNAFGGTIGSQFSANDISGQYFEQLTFVTASTFTVTLSFTAQGFNMDDTDPTKNQAIPAGQTGLGVSYQLLTTFTGSGTYSTDSSGTTTFSLTPGAGPGLVLDYDAGIKGGYALVGGQYQIVGNGDTLTTLATGASIAGNGSESCTAPNLCGSFGQMTSFNLTTPGAQFFDSPSPFYPLSLQSGQFEGFPVVVGSTVESQGSLNAIFQAVPEPGSLALVGLALAGLGLAAKRRKSV